MILKDMECHLKKEIAVRWARILPTDNCCDAVLKANAEKAVAECMMKCEKGL